MLITIGCAVLATVGLGYSSRIPPVLGGFLLFLGLTFLLLHAARDADMQIRRAYGILAYLCLAAGAVFILVALARVRTVPAERRNAVRVRDVMWPLAEVPVARPDEPLTDLLERMNHHPGTRALVFDADRLVGIVSPADVSRMMQVAALRGAAAKP